MNKHEKDTMNNGRMEDWNKGWEKTMQVASYRLQVKKPLRVTSCGLTKSDEC